MNCSNAFPKEKQWLLGVIQSDGGVENPTDPFESGDGALPVRVHVRLQREMKSCWFGGNVEIGTTAQARAHLKQAPPLPTILANIHQPALSLSLSLARSTTRFTYRW